MSDDWTRSPAGLLGSAAVGGGVGLGARLIKHLLEQRKAGRLPRVPETSAVPIEVTPEEALELERRGTDVQLKQASGPRSAVGGAIRGAVGTAAALGTYKLVDSWLESRRRQQLKDDIQRIRGRIQQVLVDQPAAEDIPLHASMKAAEDQFMKAAILGGLADASIPNWMSVPAGAAALITALTSFRQVRDDNKYRQRIGDLRRAVVSEQLENQGGPRLQLTPVVDAMKMKERLRRRADHDGNSKTTGYIERPADAGSPSQEAHSGIDYREKIARMRKRRGELGSGSPIINNDPASAAPAAADSGAASSSSAF